MGLLLAEFRARAVHIAQLEAACPSIDPHLIDLLLAHQTDLFFSRQLRVHRHLPAFEAALLKQTPLWATLC